MHAPRMDQPPAPPPPRHLLGPDLAQQRKAKRDGDVGAQEVGLGAHVGHHLERRQVSGGGRGARVRVSAHTIRICRCGTASNMTSGTHGMAVTHAQRWRGVCQQGTAAPRPPGTPTTAAAPPPPHCPTRRRPSPRPTCSSSHLPCAAPRWRRRPAGWGSARSAPRRAGTAAAGGQAGMRGGGTGRRGGSVMRAGQFGDEGGAR